MNKKNILLISHDLSVTGAPNSMLRQAGYFRDAGHNVEVWTLCDGSLKDRYIEQGFNPKVVGTRSDEICRAWNHSCKNYDFILCNTTVTYRAVDYLQRKKIPLVWFIRETKLVNDGMLNDKDFAKVFKNFYNIYTVSEYAAKMSRRYNGNVRVINNAIKDRFERFTTAGKVLRFGFIGSILKIKGVDVLVDAFSKLIKESKNVSLTIAGAVTSDFARDLVARSTGTGINWIGEIQGDEKARFFNEIDVLVVPSDDDACPLTVIEGAMLGKPVITTDTAGSNYIVENGRNGFIIKTGAVDELYESMKFFVENKDKLPEMSKYSRKMYLKYGNTDRERKEVLQMLADNLNNPPIVKSSPLFRWAAFTKTVSISGRVHLYLFGIKIASYLRKTIDKNYKRAVRKFKINHKINFDAKQIVSLGMNCLPRAILTIWGLKHTKNDGELSYPFDLAVHYTDKLIDLLTNDFDGFTQFLDFNPEKKEWFNTKYGFRYIHDKDCLPSEREKLVARLRGRVQNWRNMIQNPKPVVFVLNLNTIEMKLDKVKAEELCNNLISCVFDLRKDRPTEIIVICPIKLDIARKNVYLCFAPLPWPEYQWHMQERFSFQGIEYERKIAQFCYDVLSGNGGIK